MTSRRGNLKEGATRVLNARAKRAHLSQNIVWRRVSLQDYRGRLKSRKNHVFRLADDNERWESICRTFSVLNVSLVPFDAKAAICTGCESAMAENSGEEEAC